MYPEIYTQVGSQLMWLLTAAWLLPLLGFMIEIFGGYWSPRTSKTPAYIAVGCIGTGFLLSLVALCTWVNAAEIDLLAFGGDEVHVAASEDPQHEHAGSEHQAEEHAPHGEAHAVEPGNDPFKTAFAGTFYRLGKFGGLEITLDWYIDGLTVLMFVMVTLIATCIHIFSIGYMSDELTEKYEDHFVHNTDGSHFHRVGRFYRFFAYMSLFCFSMLGLVLAGNIFQVFIFWELVGVCSYLLIGFYVERKSASNAANKAFIMNRVGDFGFLIGLMIIWTWFGVFQFAETNPETIGEAGLFQMVRNSAGEIETKGEGAEKVVVLQARQGIHKEHPAYSTPSAEIPYWLLVTAGLGIFAGCVGKSAQFPLQTWLPDAMEGPTPVSALIHAATMVTAGVYMIGRMNGLFAMAPATMMTIAIVGGLTAFFAATIGLAQNDIKRVLAYSTVSQLGYMFLAMGVGAFSAGIFHLMTHAFFKACLFLGSGSVIHGLHHAYHRAHLHDDPQDMRNMGGLRKKMPITFITFLVSTIAISGIPFFSGFFSKDEILWWSFGSTRGHWLLWLLGAAAAGMTAFYMFRLVFMTFFGEQKTDARARDQIPESPFTIPIPLMVLGFFALIGGYIGIPKILGGVNRFDAFLAPVFEQAQHANEIHAHGTLATEYTLMAISVAIATVGIFIAWVMYIKNPELPAKFVARFSRAHKVVFNKWYIDELYDFLFVSPCKRLGTFLWRGFDVKVVDGVVNGCAWVIKGLGTGLRYTQSGYLYNYAMAMVVGVVVIVGFLVF
ncbi:MAG: NADH-quinone oxidoreductase subunit L [Candidatus Marinimicrobia bacterium]|nr:NADH-quinone oxidoreductase subunit L [Candidatus Neomarinimicrobiota bacterium]